MHVNRCFRAKNGVSTLRQKKKMENGVNVNSNKNGS